MEMYELGAAVAGALSVLSLVGCLVASFSTFGGNLRELDMRVSIFSGMPVSRGNPSWWWKVVRAALWLASLAISMLLSWFSVAFVVGTVLHRLQKDAGAPAVMKEYRWMLRNVPMTREQLEVAALGVKRLLFQA